MLSRIFNTIKTFVIIVSTANKYESDAYKLHASRHKILDF